MRKLKQPVQPQHGGLEYFQLVAAAERSVRIALDREKLPLLNPEPIMDWLQSMSESRDE
jgi:hypothetical protein